MPIGVITLSLIAIFLLFSAVLVYMSSKREKSVFLKDFTAFLFGIAGASTCWAVGVIAVWLNLLNPIIIGYLHPLAIFSGMIGLLYLCHLTLTFINPKIVRRVLIIFIFLSLVCSFIVWSNTPVPSLTKEGIILWNIPRVVGLLTVIMGLPFVGLPIIIFFYLGVKSSEKFTKLRSFFIVLGIALYMTGGLAHNIVTTPSKYLLSDVVTIFGAAFLLLSVYLKRFLKEKDPGEENFN
jgi:hypothetical protein